MFRSLLIMLCLIAPLSVGAQTAVVPQSQGQIALSFVPLVKQATPAVVNIYARRVVPGRSPFADDPFFGGFFREFGATQPRVQNSLGSGVILSAEGIVVSNFHVVGQATDIRVVLNDRREFSAQVLLADEESDLAILQLDGVSGMPHLELRDSDTVEVGELVLAIGNPFGVGQTVSSGIVSGLARSGAATGNARGYFIQTDAPINPGNSGGALIDVQGRLIGVNTSILTRSGGSNGIGFAIPSALVQQFVLQAKAGNTRFARPWAGITGQSVDAALSETLGLSVPGGVAISEIHPASPFAETGVLAGDVVLSVDGMAVNTPAEMLFRMSVRGIGASTDVEVSRQGELLHVAVPMVAPPDVPPRAPITLGRGSVLPGLTVVNLNPAVAEELGVALTESGAAISETGQVAPRVGLEVGDIILAVNGRRVDTAKDCEDALRLISRRFQVDVLRGERRLTLRFRA